MKLVYLLQSVLALAIDTVIVHPLQVAEAFKDNFLLFKEGQPLKFVVDFKKGY